MDLVETIARALERDLLQQADRPSSFEILIGRLEVEEVTEGRVAAVQGDLHLGSLARAVLSAIPGSGWKLVPEEPTEAMLTAARRAPLGDTKCTFVVDRLVNLVSGLGTDKDKLAGTTYKAALAAAPLSHVTRTVLLPPES